VAESIGRYARALYPGRMDGTVAPRSVLAPTRPWSWLPDVPAIALLAVLPAFFLKELPGGLPPYGGDIFVHVYPLLSLLARGLHAGRPTLWNFYAAGGYPLAPYSALAVYPPVVLALLARGVTGALAALYVCYLATLGVGTYLLAAELGQSRPGRLLAGVTLSCGGFVAAHTYAGHIFELGAICPLPLAYLLLRRAIRRQRLGSALWCGVWLGLMTLAAGLQFLPFALAPLPALALWHAAGRLWDGASLDPARALWPLVALALAGLVGVALGAALLIPFGEILGATLRAGAVPYRDATTQSLPWRNLITLAAPDALGNAADGTYWPANRYGPYFHEIYAYAGVLPLFLAPVALLSRARRRAALPYGVLALLSLVVMLGSNTPFYRFVYALPGAGLLRVPARAGLPLDFALALLAGFGLDALRETPRRAVAALLAPGVALLVVALAALYGGQLLAGHDGPPPAARALAQAAPLRLAVSAGLGVAACLAAARARAAWTLALPALAVLDLVTANGALIRPVDPARYYASTAAVRALPRGGDYRFLALGGAVTLGTGMVTGRLYDVQDAAPLALKDYWGLFHQDEIRRAGGGVVATSRDVVGTIDPFALRLFGVRTVLSDTPLRVSVLRAAGHVSSARWSTPGGANWNVSPVDVTSYIYHDPRALPRLFVVPGAVHASADVALTLLRKGAIDPLRTVALSPGSAPVTGLWAAVRRRWADWLAADPDNTLTAHADGGTRGGYLVVDDGWFPGWTATVDGRSTPVLRADYLLRAVHLLPGRHTVRLTYAPLSALLGAAISAATALLLLLVALVAGARRLSARRSPVSATVGEERAE